MVKNQPANAADTRDTGSISGLGRPPGVGNGNPLQYSCLENPMDRGAWQATVHGIAKSQARLSTHTSVTAIIISSVSGRVYALVKSMRKWISAGRSKHKSNNKRSVWMTEDHCKYSGF